MIESEIENTADFIFNLASIRRIQLEKKPTEFLRDLIHLCNERKSHVDYSIRISAEINLAACNFILETR